MVLRNRHGVNEQSKIYKSELSLFCALHIGLKIAGDKIARPFAASTQISVDFRELKGNEITFEPDICMTLIHGI